MILQVEIYEDKAKFPRMRMLGGMPMRSKGESPSIRLENYALERFNDFNKMCKTHSLVTLGAEQNRLKKTYINIQGLWKIAFLNTGDVDKGEIIVDGERIV